MIFHSCFYKQLYRQVFFLFLGRGVGDQNPCQDRLGHIFEMSHQVQKGVRFLHKEAQIRPEYHLGNTQRSEALFIKSSVSKRVFLREIDWTKFPFTKEWLCRWWTSASAGVVRAIWSFQEYICWKNTRGKTWVRRIQVNIVWPSKMHCATKSITSLIRGQSGILICCWGFLNLLFLCN